jgi:hypothetical protein
MKFVQERSGENYHTDDAATIYFRRTAEGAPTHLRCVGMGFALSAHSDAEFDVELAPFELIGVGNFGAGRPTEPGSDTKWTGDSDKYAVYKHRGSLLILESHGGGEQGYYARHSHDIELFERICATFPPERIWDICRLIATTQNQAYRKGRDEMAGLFLQNRLKRRKRSGQYRLDILPELTAQQGLHSSRT